MTLFVTAILCVLGCAVFFFCKRWMPSWARWGSIKTSECRMKSDSHASFCFAIHVYAISKLCILILLLPFLHDIPCQGRLLHVRNIQVLAGALDM